MLHDSARTIAAIFFFGISSIALAETVSLDLPPRLQWNANDGYCGETSFISAGLYYGQYCSHTATVSLPDRNVAYNLYRYDDFSKVPTSRFNANAAKASGVWRISPRTASKFVKRFSILSNETVVFRAVRAAAP